MNKELKNNPFKVHGIEHFSPSMINTFVNDPVLFILKYVYKHKGYSNSSAVRGHTVEKVLNQYLDNKQLITEDEIKGLFTSMVSDAQYNCDKDELKSDKYSKELGLLNDYYNVGVDFLSTDDWFFAKPTGYQNQIIIKDDDFPIPIMGYIDFIFDDKIVDLKTSGKMPSKLTENIYRQMAIYSLAVPNKDSVVVYITPKKSQEFTIPTIDMIYYKNQVKQIMFNIQKFLSVSADPQELASLLYPNFDDWRWTDDLKIEAMKIWRM